MGKNPGWGPVRDQIPAGNVDGEEFFLCNGKWGGDGGWRSERRRGWNYAPHPRPAWLPSLFEALVDKSIDIGPLLWHLDFEPNHCMAPDRSEGLVTPPNN